jgi:hypothetical protein
MVAHALSFPAPTPTAAVSIDWLAIIRMVLLVLLVAIGGLLTLMVLAKLGPVAYGLPAPFFRRRAIVPEGAAA